MRKKEEGITPQDLWDFIQAHKDKTKGEFGGFTLGQKFRPSDKIMKAVLFWNEHKTGAR